MANYYFLITALPPLSIEVNPELGFKELKGLLFLNVTTQDLERVKLLQREIDIYNIRALWLGFPFNERGNFSSKELEEQLFVPDQLPEYIVDFLQRYDSREERLRYFSSLYASFYRQEEPFVSRFLHQYFQFEREVRLVLTALRGKYSRKDIIRELQFEDVTDPFVADIIAQKDATDYTPPREYEDLKGLFMENISDPTELNRRFIQYQLDKIEEMEEPHDFSIDRVLAYVARFGLVKSAFELDKEKGKIAVEQLSQYG